MAKKQQRRPQPAAARKPAQAPQPKRKKEQKASSGSGPKDKAMIFGRQNYIWMGAGFALVLLGLAAMSGGSMDPDKPWGENPDIYSFRRITLAPIMMLGGFVLAIVGIFKKGKAETTSSGEKDNNEAA